MYRLLKLREGQQNACPFPHFDKDGKEYYEKKPSSGINGGKFNCLACARGYTDENWFTAAYLGVNLEQATKFNEMLKETRQFIPSRTKWGDNEFELQKKLEDKESFEYQYLSELNLLDIIKDARIGIYMNSISVPYFYKGQIINVTQFRPNQTPKYINTKGSLTGIVGTTRKFSIKKDYILICAGEKDMLVATKNGFNALTILGGENAKPIYFKNLFKDKKVYIAYDNDEAGMKGAESLAEWLYNYTRTVKVLNIGLTYEKDQKDLKGALKEDKEDITDFFVKYKYNDIDLWNIINDVKWWQPPALENESTLKLIKENYRVLKMLRESLNKKEK